jgi:chemotaxis protein histidine kinase CheA
MSDYDAASDFQAHFSDALPALEQALAQAGVQVVCALAQDCGRHWFNLLLQARRRGLAVQLLVPDTPANRQSSIAWERLSALGGEVHWLVPDAAHLYTSVCILDAQTVLSGAFADISSLPPDDFAGVVRQHSRPLATQYLRGIAELIGGYGSGGAEATGASQSGALVIAQALQARTAAWQYSLLQSQTLALQAELDEIQRTLQAFERQQEAAIGELLREFLDLKRQYLAQLHERFGGQAHEEQARQAEESFNRYTQDHPPQDETTRMPELDPAQQQAIKSLYRKLAMQCHPDRVESSDKAQAQALFQRLQRSYRASDLQGLQHLQAQLEAGQGPVSDAANLALAAASQRAAADWAVQLRALQSTLLQQQAQRQALLRGPTWRTLSTQSDWDLWFTQQSSHLQAEVQRYREALTQATDERAARIS